MLSYKIKSLTVDNGEITFLLETNVGKCKCLVNTVNSNKMLYTSGYSILGFKYDPVYDTHIAGKALIDDVVRQICLDNNWEHL